MFILFGSSNLEDSVFDPRRVYIEFAKPKNRIRASDDENNKETMAILMENNFDHYSITCEPFSTLSTLIRLFFCSRYTLLFRIQTSNQINHTNKMKMKLLHGASIKTWVFGTEITFYMSIFVCQIKANYN